MSVSLDSKFSPTMEPPFPLMTGPPMPAKDRRPVNTSSEQKKSKNKIGFSCVRGALGYGPSGPIIPPNRGQEAQIAGIGSFYINDYKEIFPVSSNISETRAKQLKLGSGKISSSGGAVVSIGMNDYLTGFGSISFNTSEIYTDYGRNSAGYEKVAYSDRGKSFFFGGSLRLPPRNSFISYVQTSNILPYRYSKEYENIYQPYKLEIEDGESRSTVHSAIANYGFEENVDFCLVGKYIQGDSRISKSIGFYMNIHGPVIIRGKQFDLSFVSGASRRGITLALDTGWLNLSYIGNSDHSYYRVGMQLGIEHRPAYAKNMDSPPDVPDTDEATI
ncbi:hypothetical protein ACFLZ2_06035 [Candidatus Margulisiibacteriota bacterium]